MEEIQLTNILSGSVCLFDVKRLAAQACSTDDISWLAELSLCSNIVVAKNAAWVMTHFDNKQISHLSSFQSRFVDCILTTNSTSLRRLLLNIVNRLSIRQEDIRTDFLDFCLTRILSAEEPLGVRSLCMKLSFQQCRYFPDLLLELKTTLSLIQPTDPPALRSTKNKIDTLIDNILRDE